MFTKYTENKYSRRCEECRKDCGSRRKKSHCIFLHYKQSVRSNNKPLNVSKRSLITYYSVNYFLHKNHYDFYYAEKTVNDFIFSAENKFVSRRKVSVQGSTELIKYQPAEKLSKLLSLRVEGAG